VWDRCSDADKADHASVRMPGFVGDGEELDLSESLDDGSIYVPWPLPPLSDPGNRSSMPMNRIDSKFLRMLWGSTAEQYRNTAAVLEQLIVAGGDRSLLL